MMENAVLLQNTNGGLQKNCQHFFEAKKRYFWLFFFFFFRTGLGQSLIRWSLHPRFHSSSSSRCVTAASHVCVSQAC